MTFTPDRVAISNITRALPAVVTTASAHGLSTGCAVRIHCPASYGMIEVNGNIYAVTVISNVSFSLQYSQVPPAQNVDSTNYTPFVIPAKPGFTAEVLAIGSLPTPSESIPSQSNTCITTVLDALTNNSTSEIPF